MGRENSTVPSENMRSHVVTSLCLTLVGLFSARAKEICVCRPLWPVWPNISSDPSSTDVEKKNQHKKLDPPNSQAKARKSDFSLSGCAKDLKTEFW